MPLPENSAAILYTGQFRGNGQTGLVLNFPSEGSWWLGTFTYGSAQLNWTLVASTHGNTDFSATIGYVNAIFSGDFFGNGQTSLMLYNPGNGNWWVGWLGDFAYGGFQLNWSLSNNTNGFRDVSLYYSKFFQGNFLGDGRDGLMVYHPGNGNWWLATYPYPADAQHPVVDPLMGWTSVGNTTGFGDVAGNPFFTGDYLGNGKTDVMFYHPSDGNWWLGTIPYGSNQLSWIKVSNTTGFGDVSKDPFCTGDFLGNGKTDVMFYHPGDGNWWLGTIPYGSNQLSWIMVCNTTGFADVSNDPFFIGDFLGNGKTDVMFYHPSDGNWWLGTIPYGSTQMNWTNVGNTTGFGDLSQALFFTGDFLGSGKTDVIYFDESNGAFWLGIIVEGSLTWNLAGTTSTGDLIYL